MTGGTNITPADDTQSPGDPVQDAKAALRRRLRDVRRRFVEGLPPAARTLAFHVLPSPLLHRIAPVSVIALYWAQGDEAPTASIAEQLADLGHRIALPRIDAATGTMGFALWDMDVILVPGPFRTLQPPADAPGVDPDVIVAPLVGFDRALNRLGQGGGYYDRAFAAHPSALRIGLGWSAQLTEAIATGPHDRPLDIVVTETALYEREDVQR